VRVSRSMGQATVNEYLRILVCTGFG